MASIIKKKICLIGCGNIANFHVEALKKVGFKIYSIASSYNSKTIEAFAKKHKIKKFFFDPLDMIKKTGHEVDAFLITTPVDLSTKYLNILDKYKKPILLEKPGDFNFRKLYKFRNNKNIYLAYNRRFYSSVIEFINYIKNKGKLLVSVEIPEKKISTTKIDIYNKYKYFFGNTIHIIDLLIYIFGNIQIASVKKIKDKNGIKSILAILKNNKSLINFVCNFNGSSNFKISAENKDIKYELMPIEFLNVYKGMEVIEPRGKNKLRKFFPKKIKNSVLSILDTKFKPGFYLQSKEFLKIVKSNSVPKSNIKIARIEDSIKALKLLEKIIKTN